MYRISADLALPDLIGSELNQLCLGRYDVQFVFGPTTIAVQSRATLFIGDDVIATWDDEKNWSALAFQRLLNATVLEYTVLNDQTLEIKFDAGLRLHLHDDSDQYESMQIYGAGDSNGPIVI